MDFLFIPIRDAQSTGSLEPSWYKNKTEMIIVVFIQYQIYVKICINMQKQCLLNWEIMEAKCHCFN